MLRFRACTVSHLLSSSSTSAISTLRRLFATAAPAISTNQDFGINDYLIDTCGLTRYQAMKAYMKLSHLKSPAKPDAVLAFLAGLGLSSANVAAAVAKDPRLLCAGVDRTLAPAVAGLTGIDLSRRQIARLVHIAPRRFRCRSTVSKLQCYLPLFGSVGRLLWMVERRPWLLSRRADLHKVVKPNLAFLRECGLGARNIAKLCNRVPKILTAKPERVQAMVACAEGICVPRGSRMFREALMAVAFLKEEKIAAKVDYLKKTFSWSDAEVRIALAKAPQLLTWPKDMLRCRSEFLILEVGLKPLDIAHWPAIICLSLEGRLGSRHYVLKFLKENGFVDRAGSFSSAVTKAGDVFSWRAEDYAAARRGELLANFRFT